MSEIPKQNEVSERGSEPSIVSARVNTFTDSIHEKIFANYDTQAVQSVIQALSGVLQPEDAISFTDDPLNYISSTHMFRGFPYENLQDLLKTGFYPVQDGQFGSAVFFTNAPMTAATYMLNGGVLAGLRLADVVKATEEGIIAVDDDPESPYQVLCRQARIAGASMWDADASFDTAQKINGDSRRLNIQMRKPQPVSATDFFLHLLPDRSVRYLDPRSLQNGFMDITNI